MIYANKYEYKIRFIFTTMANSMNYSTIYELCEKRKMKVKELCNYIGITYQGLKTSLNSGKLSSDKIETLCKCLNITPNQFFGWSESEQHTYNATQVGVVNSQNVNNNNVDILQQQLSTKDEQISQLLALLNK